MTDQPNRLARFSYWLPAILVAALISVFSTKYFAQEHTSRIIVPFLHWLLPRASLRALHLLHFGIRKLAHLTEFGVFSITLFRGVRGNQTGWRPAWALATLLIAACFAAIDEWHQSFVPLREASPRDVAIDTCGALFAQLIVWWYAKLKWPSAGVAKTEKD